MIDMRDIKTEVFRDSSPNPKYLVRITHIPTNLVGLSSGEGCGKTEACQLAMIDLKNKLLRREGKYMFYDNLGGLHSLHRPISGNHQVGWLGGGVMSGLLHRIESRVQGRMLSHRYWCEVFGIISTGSGLENARREYLRDIIREIWDRNLLLKGGATRRSNDGRRRIKQDSAGY